MKMAFFAPETGVFLCIYKLSINFDPYSIFYTNIPCDPNLSLKKGDIMFGQSERSPTIWNKWPRKFSSARRAACQRKEEQAVDAQGRKGPAGSPEYKAILKFCTRLDAISLHEKTESSIS